MNFEELFTVYVEIKEAISLDNPEGDSVVMISFTGTAEGKYFTGKVLPGGVDTQIIGKNRDRHTLSARYILEGKDFKGDDCKIYIENNGYAVKDPDKVLFRTYPKIITDSKGLSFLNQELLAGEVTSADKGVNVKFYRSV